MPPGDMFDILHKITTVVVVVALCVFRTGRVFGAREATVDVKLAEIEKFDQKLAEIRDFVVAAGKRMSDKVTELQGFLGKAELALRDMAAIQRDTDRIDELLGTMRERLAKCEARQWTSDQR